MKRILFVFSFFITFFCFSQNETNNWYFGNNAGLSFNQAKLAILNNSSMETPAGCTSISDSNGNLLFYSNSETIWNKNHKVMENGLSLGGNIDHFQNSIIIPKPNSTEIYYLIYSKNLVTPDRSGIFFAEIEISSKFPLGIVKNKNNYLKGPTGERLTAIHHADGKSVWFITYGNSSTSKNSPINTFYIYKIDDSGINHTPIRHESEEVFSNIGSLKISPDGKTLAIADHAEPKIFLYDFNTANGDINHKKNILTNLGFVLLNPLGIAFSSDSKNLYYSTLNGNFSTLTQYILENPTPSTPFYEAKLTFATSNEEPFGSLQLATDGKIYVSTYKKTNPLDNEKNIRPSEKISVIESPNELKLDINFNHHTIDLNLGASLKGLPNFIQSYFRNRIITENQCVFDEFSFSLDSYAPISSVVWDFGDGNTSNELHPNHIYSKAGKYLVTAKITINNTITPLYKNITVHDLPNLTENQRLIQCDIGNDGIEIFNLKNIAKKISNENLELDFFHTLEDAQNNNNKILNSEEYTNKANPQELFVKAKNKNNCYNITNFFIETTFPTPINIEDYIVCDDSDEIPNDNKGVINLIDKENQIREKQAFSLSTSIRFYPSLNDALTKRNRLRSIQTLSSTTIWTLIDNESGCVGINSFSFIVNSPPIIENIEDSYNICYETESPLILTASSEADRYEWKNDKDIVLSRKKDFTINDEGLFSLTQYKTIANTECYSTKSFEVKYFPSPKILDISIIKENGDFNVLVELTGNSTYEFSLNDIDYFGNGLSYTFLNVTPGIQEIYIKDIKRCEAPIIKEINILGYPKFFTPNSDNINDIWAMYGATSKYFKEIDIKIFNRFGKIIHVINNKNAEAGWDGTYNGKIMPSDEYWFHAILKDLNDNTFDKKGHFALMRK